jgi:hypothetical protein
LSKKERTYALDSEFKPHKPFNHEWAVKQVALFDRWKTIPLETQPSLQEYYDNPHLHLREHYENRKKYEYNSFVFVTPKLKEKQL